MYIVSQSVYLCVSPGKHGPAAPGEGVWMLLSEDVANSAARDDLQAATALPHAERDLCKDTRS